ncbi:MAG: nuclear transport factor 2 family protein [Silicimonas sp.]|nr:nuclear transport factor 2 family protein [Silicimonas sp.]
MIHPRPPLPPFSHDEALTKVRLAEDAWNTRDPRKVAQAYSPDTRWRNRSEFFTGRAEVEAFLTRKWAEENGYRLIKELWAHDGHRIAVRFCYEYHDRDGQWFRAHGNENWAFDALGYMEERHASINDVAIEEGARLFHWPVGTPRPERHPGLSDLGL